MAKNARQHIREISEEYRGDAHTAGLLVQLHEMINPSAVIDDESIAALTNMMVNWPDENGLLKALAPYIIAGMINGIRTN